MESIAFIPTPKRDGSDVTRRPDAVTFTDVVGFSKLLELGDVKTLRKWDALRRDSIALKIAEHRGLVHRIEGGKLYVQFQRVVDADANRLPTQHARPHEGGLQMQLVDFARERHISRGNQSRQVIYRRNSTWLCTLALVLSVFIFAHRAFAQSYPSKPVRFIVSSGTGGSDDFHARVMAQKFTEVFGQQFVVDNRAGAGGLIGQTAVATAPSDGYTILLTGRSITAARFLNANMNFEPQRALAPVAMLVTYSFVLVINPTVKANTVSEYIALARTQPGKITVGESGGGHMPYVAVTIFRAMTKLILAPIAYKETNQILVDLIAGRLDSYFSPIQPILSHIAAGRLRALGVTGEKRSSVLPDVPTIAAAGVPGYEAGSWLYIAAPAGTPRAVIEKLNSAVARIIAMPDVRESLMKAGSNPATSTPEELTKRIADATEQFGRIAKELGIKPQ